MLAADEFVPLATWLSAPQTDDRAADAPRDAADAPRHPELAEGPPPASPPAEAPPSLEALRDVRLFRARLAEALDAATATIVRDLAYAVLGRELRLAPADVASIVARILAEHPAAEPVAIRHAPGDTPPAGVPAVADPALAPGDCVVAFAAGEVDARLGVRLAVVLEAWA